MSNFEPRELNCALGAAADPAAHIQPRSPSIFFGENLTPVQKAIPGFGSLCYFLYLQLIGAAAGGGQPRPPGVCFNLSANCTTELFWDLVGIIETDGTID